MERETTRAGRAGIAKPPRQMEKYATDDGMWAETDRERAVRLERAICRDMLLDWVRERLAELSEVQRVSIELRYFGGLTYVQAAKVLGRDPSSVKRAEKRAIRELRAMKRDDASWVLSCEVYRFGPGRARKKRS